MRTQRQYQPSLESLDERIAPSQIGVIISPMNPLARPDTSPTVIISPMDPLAKPSSGPSVTDPTMIGPGDFPAIHVNPVA